MAKFHKKNVVDAKFLSDLANEIYDPKKKSYLRLCTGVLQNGPDPVDKKRTMHCGLGELYFKMTNQQPKTNAVDEDSVIDECLSRSKLNPDKSRAVFDNSLSKELDKLNLPKDIIEAMRIAASESFDVESPAKEFINVLNEIAVINDTTGNGTENGGVCSEANFRLRSQKVANVLREAAALLK